MNNKIEIEHIYGIEINVDPFEYGAEEKFENKIYHRLEVALCCEKLNIAGYGSVIGTEDEIKSIMENINLKYNTLNNNTVFFHWDEQYSNMLNKLKLKGYHTITTKDCSGEEIEEDDLEADDFNYYFMLIDVKKNKK